MDAQKYANASIPDFSEECGRARLLVGAKRIRKGIARNEICRVFLAENADPALTEPLQELCREADIPVFWVSSAGELGQKCGIEVAAAAAAVLR